MHCLHFAFITFYANLFGMQPMFLHSMLRMSAVNFKNVKFRIFTYTHGCYNLAYIRTKYLPSYIYRVFDLFRVKKKFII